MSISRITVVILILLITIIITIDRIVQLIPGNIQAVTIITVTSIIISME